MLLKKGRPDGNGGVAAPDRARGKTVAMQARLVASPTCGLGVQLVLLEAATSGQSQTLPLSAAHTKPYGLTAAVVLESIRITRSW